jgi:squalene-associated FAD-dependent desaturase
MGNRKVAVVGGGWAGLAAAVEATRLGLEVSLYEMAAQLGGRARDVASQGNVLDNGQHICIGAYSETLALLGRLGVAPERAFVRMRLQVDYPGSPGFRLGAGPPAFAFTLAVLRHPTWSWRAKLGLLRTCAAWRAVRFRCAASLTVAELTASLASSVRRDLVEPLCVAALNTPAAEASGAVFLRVLADALFGGPGASDLLLPRVGLGELLPSPAARWLQAAGARVHLGSRASTVSAEAGRCWRVAGERFDTVILAVPAIEAARLVAGCAPDWSQVAQALPYEPIATVYLHSAGTVLPAPMLALHSGPAAPAQFVFDRGQLDGREGLLAFVASGAAAWRDGGGSATTEAVQLQAVEALGALLKSPPKFVRCFIEKRATFRCTPELTRPPMQIAPGLLAAGDYVAGPYPATLEGAVRSGLAAARAA